VLYPGTLRSTPGIVAVTERDIQQMARCSPDHHDMIWNILSFISLLKKFRQITMATVRSKVNHRHDELNVLQNSADTFYSGISGLVLPFPKYKFPEDFQTSSRLTYYASLFKSIEINRSFYALPNGKTLAKWSKEVPEHFRFTFKLWKQITHTKGLQFQESDVKNFLGAIDYVGEKKGCLLIQFPASVKSHLMHQLEHLLHIVQANDTNSSWKVAIEFRDHSWYTDDTYNLVDTYGAAIVIHDKSKAASPHFTLSSNTVYVRFHGPQGDYRGTYSEAFLDEYATYIREWLGEGKSVFVYFNNTMGKAFDNLNKLNEYVALAK
jgi:uncharacterized protein YecE (DUF72 family)